MASGGGDEAGFSAGFTLGSGGGGGGTAEGRGVAADADDGGDIVAVERGSGIVGAGVPIRAAKVESTRSARISAVASASARHEGACNVRSPAPSPNVVTTPRQGPSASPTCESTTRARILSAVVSGRAPRTSCLSSASKSPRLGHSAGAIHSRSKASSAARPRLRHARAAHANVSEHATAKRRFILRGKVTQSAEEWKLRRQFRILPTRRTNCITVFGL